MAGVLGRVYRAWRSCKEYPLASYGFFAFLILMAPTSSFVPIKDPFVERRLYLPMFGLLLIAIEFIRRLKLTKMALGASMDVRDREFHAQPLIWAAEGSRMSEGRRDDHEAVGRLLLEAGSPVEWHSDEEPADAVLETIQAWQRDRQH